MKTLSITIKIYKKVKGKIRFICNIDMNYKK